MINPIKCFYYGVKAGLEAGKDETLAVAWVFIWVGVYYSFKKGCAQDEAINT